MEKDSFEKKVAELQNFLKEKNLVITFSKIGNGEVEIKDAENGLCFFTGAEELSDEPVVFDRMRVVEWL